MVLSNNDKTVTIYSLTREKLLKVITHPNCMNYAVISPDSTILAAVGDENIAYFYELTRDVDPLSFPDSGGRRLSAWDCSLLHCVRMDTGPEFDDKCCFTIAFSPSTHLCAIAAQSGTITVFDVNMILDRAMDAQEINAAAFTFCSSQFGFGAGAVRCMSFSPEPWDLLVWVEDHGKAGVADMRQAFSRRQVLDLNFDDPSVQKVMMESEQDSSQNSEVRSFGEQSSYDCDPVQRALLDAAAESYSDDPGGDGGGGGQNPTQRELFVEFLHTARWSPSSSSRPEDNTPPGRSDVPQVQVRRRPAQARWRMRYLQPPTTQPLANTGVNDLPEIVSPVSLFTRPPPEVGEPSSAASDNNNNNNEDSVMETPATTTSVRLPRFPETSFLGRPDSSTPTTASSLEALSRQRLQQRSSSTSRRSPERADTTTTTTSPPASRYDRFSEMRAHMEAERFRRQRRLVHEQFERRYRYPSFNLRSGRNPASVIPGNYDSAGTAGMGWATNARSL